MSEADVESFAKRLRALKDLAPMAAKEAAPLLEAAVRETASAGTSFDGKSWAPRRDGSKAFPNVAGAITAHANGIYVVIKLEGGYVYWQSRAEPALRRRVLPDGGAGLPPKIFDAMNEAASRVFARLMRST